MAYDPYATLEQPRAVPATNGPYVPRLLLADFLKNRLQGNNRGPLYPGAPGRGNTDIENDPNKFYTSRLGERFNSLFNPDPGIFESIRQRAIAEAGGRSRSAQLALQSRGGDIPGAYGVTSTLGELGGQSDLSRELGAANLTEQERARAFQENYVSRIQDFLQSLYSDYLGNAAALERQKVASKGQGKKGLGINVGFQTPGGTGFNVGFAHGGIVTRPTHALLGENGPEAVIPLGPAGDYLSRMQYGPMQPYAPGPAQDGNPSTLPLPPAPYAEPAAYKPQGILERIGELSRLIHVELGPEAPGVLKALALGAGGLAAVGEHRLKTGEETRARASDYVKKLNEGQTERYRKQLEVAGRAPVEYVTLPDGTVVKKYSAPGTAAIIAKNPSLRPPRVPRKPESEVELGKFVNDTVSRVDTAKSEEELNAIGASTKGITVSAGQHARISAAVDAARARIAAKAASAY